MIENIQAIYKNGALHPLKPLDLPEDKIVEIDVRDLKEDEKETLTEKADRVLREAGLLSSVKFPNAKRLSDAERRRLGKLFSGEKSLSDYIDEDREARG